MQTELFKGNANQLKARLDVIIASPRTINQVMKIKNGIYLIIHS